MKREQRRGSNSGQILYGVNPVREALTAGRQPREIIIAEGAREERLRELIDLAHRLHVPIKRAPRAKLDREAGNAQHQGVIAHLAASSYADADELLYQIGAGAAPLVLLLDGIEDPRNLGAILRTAECAGADGVFIPERRAAGLNEAVAKTSAGAIEHLPVARVTNLTLLIKDLKKRNVWVVGTADDATIDYFEWDWQRPSAVVLGAEGSGLHRLVRENCDAVVRIPVYGKVQSLNVSVAAGIILYEAVRQRATMIKSEHRGP